MRSRERTAPGSWADVALGDIQAAARDWRADLTLAERIKRVAAVPHDTQTSWGRKSWAKARRMYLVPFGYVPKTKAGQAGVPLLSPLDQRRARGLERMQATGEYAGYVLDHITKGKGERIG